jgi:hypothetical protein
MLVVLGLGLRVLFWIVVGGSSADHVRWGSVGSRTGVIGSELTRDCGGGRKERGLEMEIVVREIARKAPCFVCERTMLRWPRLYFGGPVRRFLLMR